MATIQQREDRFVGVPDFPSRLLSGHYAQSLLDEQVAP